MLDLLILGKYLMVPLLCCSVMALAVIVDRLRAFRLAERDTTSMRERVIECLQRGKTDEAIAACEEFGGPVAAVLLVGLLRYKKLQELGKSMTEIEANVTKTMGDYAPHVIEALEKRVNLLVLIASVSPLLGMTGTVTGMISSFNQMAAEGVGGEAVAGGISEALITTAAGLLIAIPAVVCYNIFSKKIDRYVLEIEETATELIDFITLEQQEKAPPKRKATRRRRSTTSGS